MKRPTRKLALASETIRELQRDDLALLQGGRRPPTISDLSCEPTSCEPTTERTR